MRGRSPHAGARVAPRTRLAAASAPRRSESTSSRADPAASGRTRIRPSRAGPRSAVAAIAAAGRHRQRRGRRRSEGGGGGGFAALICAAIRAVTRAVRIAARQKVIGQGRGRPRSLAAGPGMAIWFRFSRPAPHRDDDDLAAHQIG